MNQSYYPTAPSKNNARIEYKYPAIFYGYLDSWLFCTVKKKMFNHAMFFPPYEQKDVAEK